MTFLLLSFSSAIVTDISSWLLEQTSNVERESKSYRDRGHGWHHLSLVVFGIVINKIGPEGWRQRVKISREEPCVQILSWLTLSCKFSYWNKVDREEWLGKIWTARCLMEKLDSVVSQIPFVDFNLMHFYVFSHQDHKQHLLMIMRKMFNGILTFTAWKTRNWEVGKELILIRFFRVF